MISRPEAKLCRKLPLGYIARMCQNNGGEIDTGKDGWTLFPIFDDTDKKRLKRTCNDVVRETKVACDWPDFPKDALAIGANGCGDLLIFMSDAPSDRYADAVYWR